MTPRRPSRRRARTAVALLMTAAACAGSQHPRAEADRVALLNALPLDEIELPDAVLVKESTDPGAPSEGFMGQDSRDVTRSWSYRIAGDPQATCESMADQLEAQGWSIRYRCRTDGQGFHQVVLGFEVTCQSLPVDGTARFSEDPPYGEDPNVHVWLSVPYPGARVNTDAPDPKADLLPLCEDPEPGVYP